MVDLGMVPPCSRLFQDLKIKNVGSLKQREQVRPANFSHTGIVWLADSRQNRGKLILDTPFPRNVWKKGIKKPLLTGAVSRLFLGVFQAPFFIKHGCCWGVKEEAKLQPYDHWTMK
ncbi:hypothetical protein [Halodesulfovibrio sp.]|uniref:hypothetical protein n=1 Tax=Halodesulfovibrio sp. TaxID=1912772 RepID=UPI0025B919CC|nr:hypothetical protein [Halodesulfovibrio sp.]